MVRAILVDPEGVLVHSYPLHLSAWRAMADLFALDPRPEAYRALFGRTTRQIIDRLWGQKLSAQRIGAMTERKEALYRGELERNFPEAAGGRKLIEELSVGGAVVAAVSCSPPRALALELGRLGLWARFAAVVGGTDVTFGKPDPCAYALALRRLGVEPDQAVAVEATPAGVEAAGRSGIACVAVAGTFGADELMTAAATRPAALTVVDSVGQITPALLQNLLDRRPLAQLDSALARAHFNTSEEYANPVRVAG